MSVSNRLFAAPMGLNGSDKIPAGDVKVHHAGPGTNDGGNQYYPDVTGWFVVKPIGGDVVFGAGCTVRAGDAPEDTETVPEGERWMEGVLTAVQLDAASAACRLVRE